MNLADNLKKIRKENNLSQEQLAEKLGVSRQSVSKWESNLAYPEMDKVLQLCQIFNLNIDELLNQDIKEAQSSKQSKSNINKYIDDFLDYVTKTIDMFSSMKFKAKLKCLIEQVIIIGIMALIFVIIGSVCSNLLWNIVNLLPDSVNYIFYGLFSNIYRIICLVLGIVLVLHIFKVRYLDYYEIVKEKSFDEEKEEQPINNLEKKEEKVKNKIFLEKKKEKIVIRDPKHSGYKFISGLLRCLLFMIKTLAFIMGIFFCFSLIFLVICFIICFAFIKTGLLFIGSIITILSLIIINLIILIILYNFIISRKNKKNRLAFLFILSLILIGSGMGMISIGITKFDYVNDMNSQNYIKEELVIEMKDNMFFQDYYGTIEYVPSNNKDIKIVYQHPKFYDIVMREEKMIWFHMDYNSNYMDMIRTVINDINDKKITNYYNYKIYIYTTSENIDKLKQNAIDYFEESEERNSLNEEIDNLKEQLYQKENEIDNLKEQLEEKNMIIDDLEYQINNN